ncbi:MAG: hypothetical protein ACREAB_19390, partial [Blastocatellia bacterium]
DGAPSGGSGGPGGMVVTVSDGQTTSNIDFTLARGGVITGRVTDGDGRPVIAERINLAMPSANGRAQPFNGGARFGYETDDRGVYRIYGLPAGNYVVSAGGGDRPGVSRRIRYPRTYHPDAAEEAQAQIVEVQTGSVVESIDIRLGAPLKAYAVAGRAVDADSGQPVFGVPINIGRERGQGPAGASGGVTNAQGEFRVTGLTPGRYSASVRSSGSPGAASDFYSDPASFEISGDNVTGVEIRVHRGASIAGVVVVEGANDPSVTAWLSQLTISANSRGGQSQRAQQAEGQAGRGGAGGRQNFAQVGPNGSFRIGGIAPGRVRLNVNGFGGGGFGGGNGFSLVRIERDGAAINGDFNVASGEQIAGVRVVVGYGTGVIQGRVVITGGALPPGTRLRVSVRSLNSAGQDRPAQPSFVDSSGQFRFEGLLSGSYEVRLNALAGGGGFGGGRGGGAARGGGQGAVPNRSRIQIPDVRQTVNVANGSSSGVTLSLDLSQQ